ncbi:MAG TPA: gliding motility-associated C-terminal domain-containing protein, partial [Saprospiraceae bacterium]|nr:gliding motility-associated C-terminal domain-containing protein [Saprospiraceae bacterium]
TVRDITNQVAVTADPDKVVPGQSTQLTATFNPDWKYLWQPQDGSLSDSSIYNPVARPLKTTTYTVTATDENGCTGTATVTITVFTCEESVFLPNAFSPNGDQKNDILFVRARPNTVTKMELVIFSRWGEKVFESRDIQNGWDGRFKGVALPPDVFGYGLRYQCWENTEIVRKGNISLLK